MRPASLIAGVLCVLGLSGVTVLDAHAKRVLPTTDASAIGVAHNAGDHLSTARAAVASRADAIEIDVRSAGGELIASHDALQLGLEDVVFRGPSLGQAWAVAQHRGTVLLHLKERSPPYLARVRSFLLARPRRHVIIQTDDRASLEWLARELPWTERLLLVLRRGQLDELRTDAPLRAAVAGVSVRDRFVTPPLLTWLQQHGMTTFVWTVNDVARVHELLSRGVDGLITDRLDIVRLLR